MAQSEYFVSYSNRIISSGLLSGNTSTTFLNFPSLYEQIRILYILYTFNGFQNLFRALIETGIFHEKFYFNYVYLYLILCNCLLIWKPSRTFIYHGQFARTFETRINLHAPRLVRFSHLNPPSCCTAVSAEFHDTRCAYKIGNLAM